MGIEVEKEVFFYRVKTRKLLLVSAFNERNSDSQETNTVVVHTFLRKPIKIQFYDSIYVKVLKKHIALYLNLKVSSLKVFGLFICSEYYPFGRSIILCKDEELLSGFVHLSFRRVSFDMVQEMEVCERDRQANKLLLMEAKHLLENDTVLPIFSVESKKKIQRIFQMLSWRQQYSELIGMFTFWWEYYYRIDSCIYMSPPSKALFNTFVTNIAITLDYIILLNETTLQFKRIPLGNVLNVCTEVSGSYCQGIVAMDVMIFMEEEDECNDTALLECVSICTYAKEFFVSLAEEVFELSKISHFTRQSCDPDRFDNLQFKGPSYYALQPETVKYSCFNQISISCSRKRHF